MNLTLRMFDLQSNDKKFGKSYVSTGGRGLDIFLLARRGENLKSLKMSLCNT